MTINGCFGARIAEMRAAFPANVMVISDQWHFSA
jgi:aspartate aminotransferase-like enzyme